MLGQRIHQARIAAGLTLEALGECLGVTKTAIQKYEKGKTTPDSAKLLKIARACGVRTEYFFRTEAVELENVEFRKKSTFGKKRQQAVQIRVAEMVEKRVELLNVFPESPIPAFTVPPCVPEDIDDLDALEEVANQLRHHWDLGLNPISDLTDTLESLGVLIMAIDVDAQGFVGMTATAHTVDGRRYSVIAVSSQWPGDRQRFTLAHELAHMLLAGRLAEEIDEEKACDRFAGAFLVPREAVVQELGEGRRYLEPRELYHLKHEYGLAMRAWVIRALQCGVITRFAYDMLMRRFSSERWVTTEPGEPYPTEMPELFEQLVYRALGEELISEAKAASLLGIPRMQFYRERMMELPDAAANQ